MTSNGAGQYIFILSIVAYIVIGKDFTGNIGNIIPSIIISGRVVHLLGHLQGLFFLIFLESLNLIRFFKSIIKCNIKV